MEKKYQQDLRDYEDLRMESAKTRSALESSLQDKEAAEEQNRQLSKQIEQLNLSMATFKEAASGSEDDKQAIVARLQLQVNDLENRLAQSQKDEEEYRRKWELLQDFSADELTRAQKKIDELTATCSELIKQVEDANNQEHMMALVQEKEQLEAKIHEMEIQFEATVDVVNNSSQIAVQRENQIDDLKDKVAGLEKKLEEMTQQKEALEKSLEEAQQKQVESDATISGMEKSNTALKEEVMKMKRRGTMSSSRSMSAKFRVPSVLVRKKSSRRMHFVAPAACTMMSHPPKSALYAASCARKTSGWLKSSSAKRVRGSGRYCRLLVALMPAHIWCPSSSPFSTMKLPMKPLAPVTNIFMVVSVCRGYTEYCPLEFLTGSTWMPTCVSFPYCSFSCFSMSEALACAS